MKYASFGRRFLAVFIDGLIVGVTAGVLTGIMRGQVAGRVLIPTVLGWVYYIYFIGKEGATLGKKAMGIKVILEKGKGEIGYGKAFVREVLGKFVSGFILGLGYFWMLWDDKKQTWHDKIAGTKVVEA